MRADPIRNYSAIISHLATFKNYRGQGIAGKFLSFSKQLAKQKHLTKLALDVELDNETAIAVYRKYGFRITVKIDGPKFKARFGIPGADPMERLISK
jgi:ribosomal protein S18 acetylase RimI-like enzyme